MTVFRTFLKVVKNYKFVILLYTVLLVGFAGFNMQTSENNTNFVFKNFFFVRGGFSDCPDKRYAERRNTAYAFHNS